MPNTKDVYTADEFEVPIISALTKDPIPKVIHAQSDARRDMEEAEKEEQQHIDEVEAERLPEVSVPPRRAPPSRPRRQRNDRRRFNAKVQQQARYAKLNRNRGGRGTNEAGGKRY